MTTATCHCGACVIELACAPVEVTSCNCSICRRYGVLWAYYPVADVTLSLGPVHGYQWDDREITFYRCADCGCVTHWAAVDPSRDRMGINARLLPLDAVAAARMRLLDGAVTERYLDE